MTTPARDPATEMIDLIKVMSDGPSLGLSLDELAAKLDWPRDRVNDRLCRMGGRVSHAKVRDRRTYSIKYTLKS